MERRRSCSPSTSSDRPGRHERAQRALLHDQGPGAAADPTRPLGLLHPRPRRPARAGPGAAEPRLHALGDREVRRRHPRRRHPRGHRAAPDDARALAGRPADRDVARRAGQAHRPRRSPTTTCARWPRSASSSAPKRGRYQVAVSQLSVGLGLLDLGFPIEAALAAADVYAEHGREIAKELNECSAPWSGRSTRIRAPRPETRARGRRADQAALDRQPGVGVRSRRWTRPSARASPRRSRLSGVDGPRLGVVPRVDAMTRRAPDRAGDRRDRLHRPPAGARAARRAATGSRR